MPLTTIVAKASDLVPRRMLLVTGYGIPFVLVRNRDGAPRGFVNVCPHKWIQMPSVPTSRECIRCKEHHVTFEIDSGQIRNCRGYRLPHGLRPARVEIRGDDLVLHVDGSHFVFFAYATIRRLAHFKLKF